MQYLTKIKYPIAFVGVVVGLLFVPAYVVAQTTDTTAAPPVVDAVTAPVNQAEIDLLKQEVDVLNQQLQDKRKAAEQLQKEADVYAQQINTKQQEQTTLQTQLEVIGDQISDAQLSVEKTRNQIESKELEVRKLDLETQRLEVEQRDKKRIIAEYLRTLDRQDRQGTLYAILVHDSLSDFFEQQKALAEVQGNLQTALEEVVRLQHETDLQRQYAQQKKESLQGLQQKLETQKHSLQEQESTKQIILEQSQESEEKFQQLLERAKSDQTAVSSDVQSLEQQARAKLDELTAKLPPEQRQDVVADNGELSWPISTRRITAYFHDPSYPFRNVFAHPAIDIGTPQGTPVTASADGIVGVARSIGWIESGSRRYPAYNYVLIAHANVSTVYGHLSKVNVAEGQLVHRGDIIGYTGGKPGTEGAGLLTTGPHLHFEVRVNGIPADPLNYLP